MVYSASEQAANPGQPSLPHPRLVWCPAAKRKYWTHWPRTSSVLRYCFFVLIISRCFDFNLQCTSRQRSEAAQGVMEQHGRALFLYNHSKAWCIWTLSGYHRPLTSNRYNQKHSRVCVRMYVCVFVCVCVLVNVSISCNRAWSTFYIEFCLALFYFLNRRAIWCQQFLNVFRYFLFFHGKYALNCFYLLFFPLGTYERLWNDWDTETFHRYPIYIG